MMVFDSLEFKYVFYCCGSERAPTLSIKNVQFKIVPDFFSPVKEFPLYEDLISIVQIGHPISVSILCKCKLYVYGRPGSVVTSKFSF